MVIREIRKFPYEILTFFPRQPIAKILFVLHSNYTGDTPYRVWFDLDNSLVRWKRPIFNICYSGNTEISVWNTNFFPRQPIAKIIFVLHSNYTGDTPYLVWVDLDDSLFWWKRPIFKIGYSGNTQISVWNTNFFPRQPRAKTLFVLLSNYTGDTPYRVSFDLDDSLVRWIRPIFNICYSGNTKISEWNTNFFPRQPIAKIIFVLHSNYTGDTPYLVWVDLDDSLFWWKRPIFKIGYSGNTQISVWNTNFFPRQPRAKTLFVLHSNYTGDTPYRVSFDLDNSLVRWKRPIFKSGYSGNTQISVWKTYFFPRQAISKILCFTL